MTDSPAPIMLTLGYGKRSIDGTIALLQDHAVQYLVDVRSVPHSGYHQEYSQAPLKARLAAHHIEYLFLGSELGGRPDDPTCYDAQGRVDYEQCRRRLAFLQAIARLRTA